MKVFNHKLIIIILIFAALLRFNQLRNLPALNADEAAIGYNAYSLIETGKDEHGNPWPIHFQSFNDYKPGLYFYLVYPFVAIFGLTEMSVRFPSALLGIASVFVVWLLIRELFPKKAIKLFNTKVSLADISALLLAVSPWAIHFSRGGWEVNVATFFISAGLYFFLKGLKNPYHFSYSILFFVASLYAYHAARVVVPLLGVVLFLLYRKKLFTNVNKKLFFSAVLFGALLLIPLASDLLSPDTGSRASGVSIFADPGHISRINEKRGRYSSLTSLAGLIFHNKPKEYLLAFASNYFDHFWGEFLFLSGDDIQRNKVPEFGQLYLFQFPLLVFGSIAIAKKRKKWSPILAWLALSPIAAALTFQSPHALRSQNMSIPVTLISAYGLYVFLKWLKETVNNKLLLNLSYFFVVVLMTVAVLRYLHQYYNHMAKTYPFSSQYGLKELVGYVKSRQGEFESIMITDRYDQPYILFLFYFRYPPEQFQNNHTLTSRDTFGFSTVPHFDKYDFTSISWENIRDMRGTLAVGTDQEIPNAEANVIKVIPFPNGDPALEIVELK